MLPNDSPITYAPYNASDKQLVKKACKARWRSAFKRLGITLGLALASGLVMIILYDIGLATGIIKRITHNVFKDNIAILFIVSVAISFIGILANMWLFFITVPSIYFDLLRGRKKQIRFVPQQYMVPGTDKYYIKTDVPAMRFLEVNFDAFCAVENTPYLVLEMTPITQILVNIKTPEQDGLKTLHYS